MLVNVGQPKNKACISASANLYQKNVNAIVIICRLNVKNISRTRSLFAENGNNQMCMCDHKLHCCWYEVWDWASLPAQQLKRRKLTIRNLQKDCNETKRKKKIKTMQSGNLLHSHQYSENETNQLTLTATTKNLRKPVGVSGNPFFAVKHISLTSIF